VTREGKLYYDGSIGRFDIKFDNGREYGGLHCGEVIEIYFTSGWVPARIEYDDDSGWYLVGYKESPGYISMQGYPVRI